MAGTCASFYVQLSATKLLHVLVVGRSTQTAQNYYANLNRYNLANYKVLNVNSTVPLPNASYFGDELSSVRVLFHFGGVVCFLHELHRRRSRLLV